MKLLAESFDPVADKLLLEHESRHAYQWAAGQLLFGSGLVFGLDYLREELQATRKKADYDARTGGDIDSACFNAYEIDAGIESGRYGPC